jgi:hypothetical protein
MRSHKIWYFISFLPAAAALVLEILPFGAVLNFGSPDGSVNRGYFSYFDMVTFGNANFGPVPTAFFTVLTLLCLLVLLAVRTPSQGFGTAALVCGAAAFLFSLLPNLSMAAYRTDIGMIISILLLAAAVFLVIARIKIRRTG